MYDVFIKLGEIFLQLLNISITASWLVLAVIVAKFLLKKAPKWINCVLWAFVAIRLLLPFNIESPLSLVPSNETIPVSEIYASSSTGSTQNFAPQIDSGFLVVDSVLQPIITETSTQPVLQSNISIISCIWILGIVVLLIYSFISFLRVKKSVAEAMYVQENIYLCDNISTPFILGLAKPKIYLPSSLYRDDVLYVIDHEKAHIRRLDHLWKPLGYLILTLYWFNPVMWVAYVLLCKDIELACDEKVIKELDGDFKKEYSNALINCSSQRRLISACPLAFGETAVKDRIKSVLSYKKPAFWVIVVALILCVAISVGFLTVPKSASVRAIIDEKGYTIVAQEEEEIYLNIPVNVFTDDINLENGQEFGDGEVVVFDKSGNNKSYCATNIYLTQAKINGSKISLFFAFDYRQLQDAGVIYTGYKHTEKGYPWTVATSDSNHLYIDDKKYTETDVVEGFLFGPNNSDGTTEFGVSVSKEVFLSAKEQIGFKIVCTKTGYVSNSRFKAINPEMCDFIEKTILEKEDWTTSEERFTCASFVPVKTEKEKGNTKVYLIAQIGEFKFDNDKIFFSAEKSPHIATITVGNEQNGYSLADYWSLDGYKNSDAQIKEHFPEKLWDEIDNAFGYYYDMLCMQNHAKANKHFSGEDTIYGKPSDGKYVYYASEDMIKPSLTLKSNGEAVFSFSSLSSYVPTGTYTIEENILTLTTDDGKNTYVFTITDKGYAFDAFNSSEIPSYRKNGFTDEKYCPVPDKAVFITEKVQGNNTQFKATILEVHENSLLVEPFPDEPICRSANKISVSTSNKAVLVNNTILNPGDSVLVCYDGMVQETFPAQVNGTVAVYILETASGSAVDYNLGSEGIEYIEILTHTTTNELTGEITEHTDKITDQKKIQLFISRVNDVLASSSIDELDDGDHPDEGFEEIAIINVYAVDGSSISVTLPGTDRLRLGTNKRRLISAYDRQLILDALYDSRQREINGITKGVVGKLDLSDDELLKKAYTLTCDMDYKNLCDVFGEPPFISNRTGIETYYYFNDEYVVFIEKDVQVSLRKLSDPDYRHTIA